MTLGPFIIPQADRNGTSRHWGEVGRGWGVNCLVQVCLGSRMTAKCDLGCVHQRVATLGPFLIPQADRNGTSRGFFLGGEGVGCTLSGTGVS